MPLFEYTGLAIGGTVSGQISAGNRRDARRKLKQKGIKIDQLRKRKTLNETVFWKCMTLLKVLMLQNISLVDALNIAKEQQDQKLSYAFGQMLAGLKNGLQFHEVLTDLFPEVSSHTIAMLRIGAEQNGLRLALASIVQQKENKEALKAEVRKATAYPIFVMFFAILTIVVVFDTVLPEFANLVDAQNLNAIQKTIISGAGKGYSSLLMVFWVVTGLLFLYWALSKSKFLHLRFYWLLNRIPVMKAAQIMTTKRNFLEALALALGLKCSLSDGVKLASFSIKNPLHRDRVQRIPDKLSEGVLFSDALYEAGLFSGMDLATIKLAEQSNSLAETTSTLSAQLQRDRLTRISLVSQFVGPLAILVLGLVIFLVAYVIITPIISLQEAI